MGVVRKLVGAVMAASIVTATAPSAAAVVFTLQDVAFNDGTTAGGSFTMNDALTAITTFSLSTQAGRFYVNGDPANAPGGVLPGDDYTPASAEATVGATTVDFTDYNQLAVPRTLYLDFGTPLTTGTRALVGMSGEYAFFASRRVVSGSVVSAVVSEAPEPASWTMMIGGFGAIGAAMRRRRIAIRFA